MSAITWSDGGLTISLKDTTSVVIGASEGIGAAIAVGLARAGSRIVAGGRDPSKMAQTVEMVRQAGGTCDVGTVDVRDPDSVNAFAGDVLAGHGAPTILVNSMGGTLVKEMLDVEVEEWDNLLHTHLRGTFLVCRSLARAMAGAGYGKIINLSSPSAIRISKRRGTYAVAKAGLNMLTSVLASEWGAYGIRVNGLAPATTKTPRVAAQLLREPGREDEVVQRIPLGRLGLTDDMVGPAIFLASTLSDFITGQTILVDGGLMTVR